MKTLKFLGIFILLAFIGCDDLTLTHPLSKYGDKENFLDVKLLGDWYYIKKETGEEDKQIIYRIRFRDKNSLEISRESYLDNTLLITSKINNKTYLSKGENNYYNIYRYEVKNDLLHIYYYEYKKDKCKTIDNSKGNIKNNLSKILKNYEEKYWGYLEPIK